MNPSLFGSLWHRWMAGQNLHDEKNFETFIFEHKH
jgi:hypothetical protein